MGKEPLVAQLMRDASAALSQDLQGFYESKRS